MRWFWQREDQDSFFQLLYESYFGAAYRAAWMITRDYYLAEDAVQDAFCYVNIHLKDARIVENPGAWIVSLATKRAIDEVRKQKRRPALLPNDVLAYQADFGPTPEDAAITAGDVRNLCRLIDDLRPEYAQVIRLFYYHQKTEKEIGGLLGVPIGTAKTWMHRARAALRKGMRDDRDQEDAGREDRYAAR